ncbi:unnamed protein product [Laminaria digitata]
MINLMDPKLVIVSARCFDYHFRDGLQPEMGLHFRSTSAMKKWRLDLHRDGFPHIVGGNKRCDKPKTAVAPRPQLSSTPATGPVLLAVPRYPPPRASDITTSRWDLVVVIVSTTTTAFPLSRRICDVAQPQL